jgi:hypothetical protein
MHAISLFFSKDDLIVRRGLRKLPRLKSWIRCGKVRTRLQRNGLELCCWNVVVYINCFFGRIDDATRSNGQKGHGNLRCHPCIYRQIDSINQSSYMSPKKYRAYRKGANILYELWSDQQVRTNKVAPYGIVITAAGGGFTFLEADNTIWYKWTTTRTGALIHRSRSWWYKCYE